MISELEDPEDLQSAMWNVDKDGNTFMHLAFMTTATTISARSEEFRGTEELSDKKSVRFSADEKQHVLANIIRYSADEKQHVLANIIKGLCNRDNMIIVKQNKDKRTTMDLCR